MKRYKRNIKCEYFEVVCRNILDNPNQSDRLFDLSLFIEKGHRKGKTEKTGCKNNQMYLF